MIGALRLGVVAAAAASAVAPVSGGFPEMISVTKTEMPEASVSVLDVLMPATVAAGDLLLMAVANGSTRSISVPSGWSALDQVAQNNVITRVFWRTAAGTEGGTTVAVSISAGGFPAALVMRIAGGTFDGLAMPSFAAASMTAAAIDPPSLSPAWGSAQTLWILLAVCELPLSGALVSSYPYLDGQAATDGGLANSNAFVQLATCYAEIEAATEDPGSFGRSSSSDAVAWTIAIKPT